MKWALFLAVAVAGCAAPSSPPTATTSTVRQIQSRAQPLFVVNPSPPSANVVLVDVGLAWDASASSGEVSYNLYYGTGTGAYSNKLSVGTSLTAMVTGLRTGQPYFFAVDAQDAQGIESALSPELVYYVPMSLDLFFTFNQPVTNVTLQASPDLSHWVGLGTIPTNGVWRVTPNQSVPMGFYRGAGQPL